MNRNALFDPDPPNAPALAPRPRDAATLILVRRSGGEPSILMGRRSGGHAFMPGKWVFPGGKVERGDALAPAVSELPPPEAAKLAAACRARAARAFPLAAIRETFEETGLVVGRTTAPKRAPPAWSLYSASGAAPELDRITFICRAVTPPRRIKRFDARFFMADADAVLLDDKPRGNADELLDIAWFSLEEALALDLPNVTRWVLGEVRARLDDEDRPTPFLRWTRGEARLDHLR